MAGPALARPRTRSDAEDDVMSDDVTNDVDNSISTFHKAKIAFLVASFVSLALSVGLWIAGERTQAIFVGIWVPSIHSLGTLVLTGEGGR